MKSTPLTFTLHDFLTRIVPGAILVLPALTGIYVFYPDLFTDIRFISVIVLIMSFLLGEIIDQFRAGLFRVPRPFYYLLYKSTGDLTKMPSWYQKVVWLDNALPDSCPPLIEERDPENYLPNRLEIDFKEEFEIRYGLNCDTDRPRDIYDIMLLDLEPELSSRTHRHRSLYIFTRNLQIATVFAFPFYLLEYLANMQNGIMVLALFSLLFIAVSVFVYSRFLDTSPHLYVELLLKEFYLKRGSLDSTESKKTHHQQVGRERN